MLAALLGVVGCGPKDFMLKPPRHPEEITVPPPEEDKFRNPPDYPKETLNQDEGRKPSGPPTGLNGMPQNIGGRGGMGGMGPMGGMGMGSPGGMGGRPY